MADPFLLTSATGTSIGAGSGPTGTFTLTTGVDSPAGNVIEVVGLGFPHFTANNTCVDSHGNVYALVDVWSGEGIIFSFHSSALIPSGTTIVITSHDGGGFASVHGGFYAVSKDGFSGPDLIATAAFFSGTASPGMTTSTPHAANEIALGCMACSALGGTWTLHPPTGWGSFGQINDGGSTVALHWVGTGSPAVPITYAPTLTGAFIGFSQTTLNVVTLSPSIAPSVGSILITGHAPTLILGQHQRPLHGSLVLTGHAPTLSPPGVSGKRHASVRWL